ncbi:hypothetical protein CR513_25389, partial [Mucuna pruriens]
MQKIPYASIVGSLIYTQVCTRPNITFVVGVFGREQKDTCSLIESLKDWRSLGALTSILLDVKIVNAPHLDTSTCWLDRSSTKSKLIDVKFLVVKERVQNK